LAVGLKVDSEALPPPVIAALGELDLKDPNRRAEGDLVEFLKSL
jgi:hypothetical protein